MGLRPNRSDQTKVDRLRRAGPVSGPRQRDVVRTCLPPRSDATEEGSLDSFPTAVDGALVKEGWMSGPSPRGAEGRDCRP